jgi:hypothetical protein
VASRPPLLSELKTYAFFDAAKRHKSAPAATGNSGGDGKQRRRTAVHIVDFIKFGGSFKINCEVFW